MAHLVSGNDKFPDLGYDDDYRFYLITRRDASGDYRFARMHARRVRVRARRALRRVNGYFRKYDRDDLRCEGAADGARA
jgi:hypothetical protein